MRTGSEARVGPPPSFEDPRPSGTALRTADAAPATTPLDVLLVEDSEDDATLVLRELRRGGFAVTSDRVQTRDDLARALAERPWQLVLTDYSMPRFDAPGTLEVVREHGVDLPVIIVSGTVGEEAAVAALKAGAQDFITKHNLSRLVPAVRRELREARAREAGRQAESALRASEMRLRRLAESGVIGILVAEDSGRVAEANDAFLQMVGYSRDDLDAGRIDWIGMTPPDWSHLNAPAIEQLRLRGAATPFEKEYVRKDGTRVPVLVAGATIDPSRYISVVLDLSERKRLEEQFRHAQRLEAVGTLAGGVAHDFNNLLSVILSYTDLLLDGTAEDDPAREDLNEVRKAGERAAGLTRQLLAFSRRQMLQPRVIELNQVLVGVEKMLGRLVGEDVDLSIMTAHDAGKIHADPGQIEQVIVNLVVNARDAMPAGGRLTIETENVDMDAEHAARHPGVTPGPHVLLAVTDTGTGMDAATQTRIFEPFFTTKEKGKGTGLGLSTVFGIVQQTGGHIEVQSEFGRGTTFRIYFPRTQAAVAVDGPSTPPPTTLRGTETILLVEDEDAVRAIMRTALRRYGYEVLEAKNAGEAFLLSEKFGARIHMLLTDLVMPRMSGRELAERLQPVRPEMKVLYVSGYTEDTVVHHGVVDPGVSFLQKPITPTALVQRVREVLGAGSAARSE